MNILVADYQPLVRRGLIEVLSNSKEAYSFFEAGTLEQALEIIKAEVIDVLFVELHLESYDGLELIKKAQQFGQRNIKYIILASSISIFELRHAMELGVNGYILKDALVEDVRYVFNVVRRGEKFYPARIIEKTFSEVEGKNLKLLTAREMEVFTELRKGLTNCQISNNLYITEGTTKKHISSILNKLKLSNRMEAVVYANKLYRNQSQ
jgi:two-component system nitrate/nitrite response regulator NarL